MLTFLWMLTSLVVCPFHPQSLRWILSLESEEKPSQILSYISEKREQAGSREMLLLCPHYTVPHSSKLIILKTAPDARPTATVMSFLI